ncbi:MAG: polyprenyl diphosphate synthase [Algiphilus sp.]
MPSSSTTPKPPARPALVAVIMDGNGRWASQRGRPRALGHRVGVQAARRIVEAAADRDLPFLSLFAFSQENWNRPEREVRMLLHLFGRTLRREGAGLQRNGVRMRFIGNREGFPEKLQEEMRATEAATAGNQRLGLLVALGYGGQWDICQAAERARQDGVPITNEAMSSRLSTAGIPEPDLLIRTGGERRISNFMLWQLAYSELYFCDTLWPDFDARHLDAALDWYAQRQRRFGSVEAP